MALDEHYICQRAANAIISEIGPFRVSTDALQSINQFLDEFIVLLLTCSLSLDLSQIKSVVVSLLPSSLGKNAIVEAELEVKTFTETESIDYELYERMRNLGEGTNERFPLDEAIALLREKCFEYCTLADKEDQLYLQKSIKHKRDEATMRVVISPIVAIYVTTIMEHIAEYLLTAVAMTAEHEDTDYVRVKEVFLALNDDIQLGDVFNRMDLKEKMEKRAGIFDFNKVRVSYIPTNTGSRPQSPMLNMKNTENNETGSFLDISFDDLDLEYFDDNPRKSTLSTASKIPEIMRPHSAMSHTNQQLNNRKSTFHLFKHNRNSFSGDVLPRASSPTEDDSDLPVMNFDELIKSGGTVKVSLTPNRLRSIEVKDQTRDDLAPPQPTWERRSTSSPRLSAANLTRPSSPLVRQASHKSTTSTATTTTTTTTKKAVTPLSSLSMKAPSSLSVSSSSSGRNSSESDHQKPVPEVPKLNQRPQTPSSPLSKSTFAINNANRFENPREAPKPPSTPSSYTTEPMLSSSLVKTSSTPVPTTPTNPISPSTSAPSLASTINTSLNTITTNTNTTINTTTTNNNKSPSSIKNMTPLPKLPSSPPTTNNSNKTPSLKSSTHTTSSSTISSLHNPSSDSIPSVISSVHSMPSPILTSSTVKTPATNTTISIQEPPIPRPTKSNTINTNGMLIRRSSGSSKKSRDHLRKMKEQEDQQKQQEKPKDDDPQPTAILNHEDTVPLTDEPEAIAEPRQVHFDQQKDEESVAIPRPKKAQTLSPERPSSMVAKRASMLSNHRRRSLHETYATDVLRQRHGSVSVSIKQWDDLNNKTQEEPSAVIPPVSHRRSVLRQLRQQQQQQMMEQEENEVEVVEEERQKTYAVLDKVLKFESSIADHQRVSHMPRRERFLYLQQDPSAIERKSIVNRKTIVKPITRRVIGVDQGVQTEPIVETKKKVEEEEDSEHGEVDGDEEWFLQDSEWDEQEETAIVEWLLGE